MSSSGQAANELRGEAAIGLGGEQYLLRPTFSALVGAEAEFGSLFAMVERASEGSLTVGEITGVLWHCLVAEPKPDRDTFGASVLELGLVEAAKPLRQIFAQILKGTQ